MGLFQTNATPPVVAVTPGLPRPRFWATAWTLGVVGRRWSQNTLKTRLRHIDRFYLFCDERFGVASLDVAIGEQDADRLQRMVEDFYLTLTVRQTYTSTDVQCWDAVRAFVQHFARQRAVNNLAWRALTQALEGTGRIRSPQRGRIKFARALPEMTLVDLLAVAQPDSVRNPFKSASVRWRNWLALHLMLLCGLRRGEVLLLTVDSLKHDLDRRTAEVAYWVDVTVLDGEDDRSTRPSIKTAESHRQIPVSIDIARLFEFYVAEMRERSDNHNYLLTAHNGMPLSAESVNKMLSELSDALTPKAFKRFQERTGNKKRISPHDLRHTCATARYAQFIARDSNRELAMQRMRAFFGWAIESEMPAVYARAAIHDDLLRSWDDLFEQRVLRLRKASG